RSSPTSTSTPRRDPGCRRPCTQLPDLTVGQVLGDPPVFITRDGDSNQEDITNDAVLVWQVMPCYRLEVQDNPGVDHVTRGLLSAAVHQRLLMHLQLPRSQCPLR